MKEVFCSTNVLDNVEKYKHRIRNASIALIVTVFISIISITAGIPEVLIICLPAGGILAFLLNNYIYRQNIYLQGFQGERLLREVLRKNLSDDYTAYYGVPIANIGDIDCVLVGPKGVFTIEVKHHKGQIQYTADGWRQIKIGQKGTAYLGNLSNPGGQALTSMRKFKEFLASNGVNIWIQPILVFTHPETQLFIEKDTSPLIVCKVEQLIDVINNSNKSFPSKLIERINTLLLKKSQRENSVEECNS